jgi:Methylamine utilisation protein MauE
MGYVLLGLRQVQVPLLAVILLGASAAKFARVLRVGRMDAGLGPTALFPMPLRRPVAVVISVAELACGVGLLLTAIGLGRGELTTAARLATFLLFLVATVALVELRGNHPTTGCGCFGDLSTAPVGARTLTRSALLAAAAMATVGLPGPHVGRPGPDTAFVLVGLAAELAVICALSPEVGEALVRLGYAEPCELRRVPAARTLASLRKSAVWRKRHGLITANAPVDMWRELCWRYVVYPALADDRPAEVVFAVSLRPHRPVVHAALIDAATGAVLEWPATPGWRGETSPNLVRVPAATNRSAVV